MSRFEAVSDGRALVKAWTRGVPFEDEARRQVLDAAALPFVHRHVAVMPDVHAGIGATVGSVIPTKGALVPAAVGVDIGCGMVAVETNLTANDLPSDLRPLREAIERRVPHGRTDNGGSNDRGGWGDPPPRVVRAWEALSAGAYERLAATHPRAIQRRAPIYQLGTLGTGNHFVEVCLDDSPEKRVWFMLHSGSRGPGNRIGSYFIERAKEECARWFVDLPNPDLAYLPEGTPLFEDYRDAILWAQDYARTNRDLMMEGVFEAARVTLGRDVVAGELAVNCHHNYVARENHFGANVWVTRKGAVRARRGDLGIIPGSMGARSYIVRGLGNPESFDSCSHGAGRAMSRAEARRRFSVADHVAATAGVECRKDEDVVDETPAAYKDIDLVMAAQSDLVEIVRTLKQVVCVKG